MPDATISAAGLRIVKLLVGNLPQTIADLLQAAGVTRTAVTEQLNALVAVGFVDGRIERRSGRGRPRHLFSATRDSLVPTAITSLFWPSGGRLRTLEDRS